MKEVIVQEGDTLIDLALIYYGSITAVVMLAKSNDLSVSSNLTPGQKLLVYPEKVVNNLTAKQLQIWLER